MKGEELGKLLLDGLLVAQNGCLVAHYCVHVTPQKYARIFIIILLYILGIN